MASCTAQDTSKADAPGSDARTCVQLAGLAGSIRARRRTHHRIGPAVPPQALGLAITTTTRGGTTTR